MERFRGGWGEPMWLSCMNLGGWMQMRGGENWAPSNLLPLILDELSRVPLFKLPPGVQGGPFCAMYRVTVGLEVMTAR
jgi:hypothetical protein